MDQVEDLGEGRQMLLHSLLHGDAAIGQGHPVSEMRPLAFGDLPRCLHQGCLLSHLLSQQPGRDLQAQHPAEHLQPCVVRSLHAQLLGGLAHQVGAGRPR